MSKIRPNYYLGKGGEVDVIDVVDEFELGFNKGLAFKYMVREGNKNTPGEDIKKAIECLQRELALIEHYNGQEEDKTAVGSDYDIDGKDLEDEEAALDAWLESYKANRESIKKEDEALMEEVERDIKLMSDEDLASKYSVDLGVLQELRSIVDSLNINYDYKRK